MQKLSESWESHICLDMWWTLWIWFYVESVCPKTIMKILLHHGSKAIWSGNEMKTRKSSNKQKWSEKGDCRLVSGSKRNILEMWDVGNAFFMEVQYFKTSLQGNNHRDGREKLLLHWKPCFHDTLNISSDVLNMISLNSCHPIMLHIHLFQCHIHSFWVANTEDICRWGPVNWQQHVSPESSKQYLCAKNEMLH